MTLKEFVRRLGEEEDEVLKESYISSKKYCIRWYQKQFSVTLESAEDIYAEALVILYQNASHGRIKKPSGRVRTYLCSVGKNIFYNQMRKSSFPDYDGAPYQELDLTDEEREHQDELMHIVEQSLNELEDPCRTLLTKYYIERKSMAQISKEMGYANHHVSKNMRYKCMVRLKSIIESKMNMRWS